MTKTHLPPFEGVVELHGPAVLRFCVAQAGPQRGEDVFQETMLAALRSFDELREPTAIRSWLFAIAARKAGTIARNAAGVVAVELIAGAQGVDFHAPLKTSPRLRDVQEKVRALTPRFTADRYWADDMAALQAAVLAGGVSGFQLD